MTREIYDLLVIGGGVNGVGIARDAAGRGLSVLLCEMGDLAGATSSASSKLIHGGLRYLEHYAFRLVAEALREREVLLRAAPHIIWPMRFVLPHAPHLRPAWMIRAGLWLYDRLGGRQSLPRSAKVSLVGGPFGAGLRPELQTGFVYSDCWVDDARFVVLGAVDAAQRGARICTRTRCRSARRVDGLWRAVLEHDGRTEEVAARAVVNAAGPWVQQVIAEVVGANAPATVRLVKGSHIVVPRLYEGEHALILQNEDGRVVFIIPYEGRFSLIGTTDVSIGGAPGPVEISPQERDYLCAAVSRFLAAPVLSADVVWSYAGVRPLYDDGEHDPSAVTRDYMLSLDAPEDAPPLLSVFGGKITTARELSERAVDKLQRFFPAIGEPWTRTVPLPGGDIENFEEFAAALAQDHPGLDPVWLFALARRHGTRARSILDAAASVEDLGTPLGGGLYGREVDWFVAEEWARAPEDVLWRRSKFGLHMTPEQRAGVADYLAGRMAKIRSG